jgi:SAM-dependent methyltransferase
MLQYNHNKHYIDLLLRQIPAGCRSALDVGCGDGGLARRLSARLNTAVTGIDRDRAMIEQARSLAGDRLIRFIEADFIPYNFDEQFDFIVASASLHHMPFEQALAKMASLRRLLLWRYLLTWQKQ